MKNNNLNPLIRTRFAPSPTGYLHIGGARTALFNWLFTKKLNGVFVLRIEDTDVERSTEASADAILSSLAWLQLDYAEGPFYQSQRMDRYRDVIAELVNNNKAYRCYCSKERLETLRATQLVNKEKPRYDGHCRHLLKQELNAPHVIRFRNPNDGAVTFDDLIRGQISFSNTELDDLIIARTDGTPTYNFTVVVDDWDMKISHVIRGDDHLNNTPRQINILRALNATLPIYAHVPMILGADGKRLSKRHGAVSVMQYHDDGYLPEALLNYLVRLGWSYKDQEIFSRDEMIQLFDISTVSRSAAAFNPEKLRWLNQQYLKTTSPVLLVSDFVAQLQKMGLDIHQGPAPEAVIALQVERNKTLQEMALKSTYFYQDQITFDADAAKQLTAEVIPALQKVHDHFSQLTLWEKESIHQTILSVAEELQLKLGKLAQPIRAAVTGGVISPSIDATLYLIGQTRTCHRLAEAIVFAKNK
jgi:glutamyl-tRNA synthetase